jgi:hypothetical protein
MILYRVMSYAEFRITKESSKLVEGTNCSSGKWFAENYADVLVWASKLGHQQPYYIVKLEVDAETASRMYRHPILDLIGPARFLERVDFGQATILDFIIVPSV